MAVSPGSNSQTTGQPASSSAQTPSLPTPGSPSGRHWLGIRPRCSWRSCEAAASRPIRLGPAAWRPSSLTSLIQPPRSRCSWPGLALMREWPSACSRSTDSLVWPLVGMRHTLLTLGIEPAAAVLQLLECGLVALDAGADQPPIDDLPRLLNQEPTDFPEAASASLGAAGRPGDAAGRRARASRGPGGPDSRIRRPRADDQAGRTLATSWR